MLTALLLVSGRRAFVTLGRATPRTASTAARSLPGAGDLPGSRTRPVGIQRGTRASWQLGVDVVIHARKALLFIEIIRPVKHHHVRG